MRIASFFILLLSSIVAHAQTAGLTGNMLHQTCNSTNDNEKLICTSYVLGLVGGAVGQAALSKTNIVWCAADAVTIEQYRDIFAKYLNDHPENRHIGASIIFFKSMLDAFPCKK